MDIIIIIIIGLFNIAAKGWIEQYAISRM